MDSYLQVAQRASEQVLVHYSTSFGYATKLLPKTERQHITNIYALVRIADEIVDTYRGPDALVLLDALERDVYGSLRTGYSTNLVVHAFAQTAAAYDITDALIKPFFASMRDDLATPHSYTQQQYDDYIYGSAAVVGLMCLKVFCAGDVGRYEELAPGAKALGDAFQKVNFLRDMAADHEQLDRYYFPVGSFDGFDETTKQTIIADVRHDFVVARAALVRLPVGARRAVGGAHNSYVALLNKLEKTAVNELKQRRVRISNSRKLWLLVRSLLGNYAQALEQPS